MANDFWKAYNENQKRIMLEQEKEMKGKPGKPVKVGNWPPKTTSKPTAQKSVKKK